MLKIKIKKNNLGIHVTAKGNDGSHALRSPDPRPSYHRSLLASNKRWNTERKNSFINFHVFSLTHFKIWTLI